MSSVSTVVSPSVPFPTRAPVLQQIQAREVAAASNSQSLGVAVATPSADDHQAALNIFGNAVKDSFQGQKFGAEDLGRFKTAIAARLNDPNLSQGQKDALRKIAGEFEASNDVQGSPFDSADWVTFLGKVGALLKSVPGGEKIGDALVNLGGLLSRSYNQNDGKFGADDIGALQRRSGVWRETAFSNVADLAQRLIGGGRAGEGGNVVNAANFGSLFAGLSLGGSGANASAQSASVPNELDIGARPSGVNDSGVYASIGGGIGNTYNTFNVRPLPVDWAKTFPSPMMTFASAWQPAPESEG